MRQDYFVDNNGVEIHFVVLNQASINNTQIPWIMIPGMGNSANEIIEDLRDSFPVYQIHINLRGRGKSDSPDTGYTLNDQVSDIDAVVNKLGLQQFYLYGHSVGSSIALRYAHLHPQKVAALAMGDHLPFYPPFNKKWVSVILQNKDLDMSAKAVNGIATAAEGYIELSKELAMLPCPTLLIRGGQQDAFFKEQNVPYILQLVPTMQIELLNNSGHDLLSPSPEPFAKILQDFANRVATTA